MSLEGTIRKVPTFGRSSMGKLYSGKKNWTKPANLYAVVGAGGGIRARDFWV